MNRLFPRDSDEIIEYSGERTLDAMTKFLKSHGKEASSAQEEVIILKLKLINFEF